MLHKGDRSLKLRLPQIFFVSCEPQSPVGGNTIKSLSGCTSSQMVEKGTPMPKVAVVTRPNREKVMFMNSKKDCLLPLKQSSFILTHCQGHTCIIYLQIIEFINSSASIMYDISCE